MPRSCSVVGCRSNYKTESEHVSTFNLPVDEKLKETWLRKIPNDVRNLKRPQVCMKHFQEKDIIWYDKCIVKGELKEFKRIRPKLAPDAIPIIFQNVPKYLSQKPSTVVRLADVEGLQMESAIKASLESAKTFEMSRKISTLEDILQFYNSSNALGNGWILMQENNQLFLCLMCFLNKNPSLLGSIVIEEDLTYTIYIDNCPVSLSKVPKSLQILNNKNIFEELLKFVELRIKNKEDRKKDKIDDVIKDLTKISDSECEARGEVCVPLLFLIEQLHLYQSTPQNRRYVGNTLIFACSLFIQSSASYMSIYKSKVLFLPHPRNIKKLIGKLSLTGSDLTESIDYLKSKIIVLKEHELIVNLHIDEIYIKAELNFKGGHILGSSSNDPSKVAKTALVFMISSLCSNYKDVVCIIPISTLVAEQLKLCIMDVLREVEAVGFHIISIISDNNAVNRKAFQLFSDNNILEPCITHPLDPARKLFFIFDVVHILKCIRNNWISNRVKNSVLTYPDFEVDFFESEIQNVQLFNASFKLFEELYEKEKNSLVKYGHLLCYKALYPTNIQKQNVSLALRIFNDKNIAALKLGLENNQMTHETCKFVEIISTWWKMVNVQSAFEGLRFNDPYREPVRDGNSLQINFFKKISLWLQFWRDKVPNSQGLSNQTFQSFITTSEAFILLIPYLFQNYKFDYILLSKFQNDVLEGRFGIYRQLSGANYYISYVQLLESERRMRFKSTVLLTTKNNVPLRSILSFKFSYDPTVDTEHFLNLLKELKNFSLEFIPEDKLPILTYIAGYAVRKDLRLKNCQVCTQWLQLTGKVVEVDLESLPYDLIMELDRGKLTLPTEYAISAVAICWMVFQKIIDNYYNDFIDSTNHLSVLHALSNTILQQFCSDLELYNFTLENPSFTCLCQQSLYKKLVSINLRACKTFLNNFVKMQNDSLSKKPSGGQGDCTRKIKKLKA